MFKSKKTIIRVGVLSAMLVAFGAPAAFAAGSFDVTAGSAPAGTVVSWSATTVGALPQVTFKDTTGGTTLNCASGIAAGSITTGPGRDGDHVGTIDGAATVFNGCNGPFGLSFTVTGRDTWNLNATGDTVGGVTPLAISGVAIHFASSSCAFDLLGSLDGSYTNGATNGSLTLAGTSPTLTISNATGGVCAMFNYANGHAVSLKTTYQVAANTGAYNPIRITSNP